MKIEERYEKVIAWFAENMPVAETELDYKNPFELLVAVILSAQCTDKRVNLITPGLLEQFPDASTMAKASMEEIFELIKSCSYPNNKARHLSGMAKMVAGEFDGVIPDSMEKLQKLPGVGRKTANVILSVAFNQPAMAVDTHVFRVAARIGLTSGAKDPYEAEMQLVKHIPEKDIPRAHHWLILHGRYVCTARNPACASCGLNQLCKYVDKNSKS